MTNALHTSPCLKPFFTLPLGAFAMQPHGARLSQYTPFQCIQLSHNVTSLLQYLCHSAWLSLCQGDGLAGVQGHCPGSHGYHPVLMVHLCMMRADCDADTWAHTPSFRTEINQMMWGGGNDEVLCKGFTVQDIQEANLSVLDLHMTCQVSPRQFHITHRQL